MNLRTSYLSGIKGGLLAMMMLVGALLSSCTKLQFTAPANVGTIRFANSSYTIERNAGATTITLPLSLPLESDATALVTLDNNKTTAQSSQYAIDPLIPANGITLSLPKGSTQASFTITSAENFEGDIVIALKLSNATGGVTVANSNAATLITIHGKPIVLPALTASVVSLSFGNVSTTGTSTSQSFTVSGVKLTAPVSVTADANFKVSLDNTNFSQSVSITAAAAMAAPVTVYAQFVANTGVNQALSGNITLVSGTLSTIVGVSGTEVGNAAPGILVTKEDFNYGAANGNITAVSGGVWTAYSASGSNPVPYSAAGLTYAGYTGSGIGGSLVSENRSASSEDVSASFTAQTNVVYMAQMMNFVSAPTSADFFMSFGDGAAGATPVYYNRFYAKANGSQMSLGISRNASTTPAYSATNLDYGTTYLVVTKYDFTNGTSSLYILSGTIPAIEPATPNVTSSGGAADPTSGLTRIIIRQNTATPLKVNIDGIRVATSWKAAVGLGL